MTNKELDDTVLAETITETLNLQSLGFISEDIKNIILREYVFLKEERSKMIITLIDLGYTVTKLGDNNNE